MSAQSTGRAWADDKAGSVVTYAGGRQRAITSAGLRTKFTETLRQLTLPSVQTLVDWIDKPVQVRDHRGQRLFCVYHGVNRTEYKDPTLYDATITFEAITVAEGV